MSNPLTDARRTIPQRCPGGEKGGDRNSGWEDSEDGRARLSHELGKPVWSLITSPPDYIEHMQNPQLSDDRAGCRSSNTCARKDRVPRCLRNLGFGIASDMPPVDLLKTIRPPLSNW